MKNPSILIGNTAKPGNTAKLGVDIPTNYGTTENDLQSWVGYGAARRQREYETYMSNTAYQRAVEDMKAAGLNPGLMYESGGPASTPSLGGSSAREGKGIDLILGIANLLFGSAKMMKMAKSNILDQNIAKTTLNIAKRATDRTYSAKKINSLYDDINKIQI